MAGATVKAPAGPAAIGLSREELWVIMRLLKVEELAGFDLDWLRRGADGVVPEALRPALEAATNALAARGYLDPTSDTSDVSKPNQVVVRLASPVIALVGACAFGEYGIMLSVKTPQSHERMYLHELRGMGVLHDSPLPHVHRFMALEGRAGVLSVIQSTLRLNQQSALAVPPGSVAESVLGALRTTVTAGQTSDLVAVLSTSELHASTLQALLGALHAPSAVGTIAIFGPSRPGQPAPVAQAVMVVTPTTIFLLEHDPARQHLIRVASIGADGVRQWIGGHLPPATVGT